MLSAAACMLLAWVHRSHHAARPGLVDPAAVVDPAAIRLNVLSFTAGACLYVVLVLTAVLVQTPAPFGLGLGVLVSGLSLVPCCVMSVFANNVAWRFSVGAEAGLPLLGCGFFLISAVLMIFDHHCVMQIFLATGVAGIGCGLTFVALPALVALTVPDGRVGEALAVNQVLRTLGFAVGSALGATGLAAFGRGQRAWDMCLSCVAAIWALCMVVLTLPRSSAPTEALQPTQSIESAD